MGSLRNRKRQIRNLAAELDEVLAEHKNARSPDYYRQYAEEPVRFVEEELGEELMDWQAEFLEDLLTESQIAIQSGHAMGKDHVASRAALWHTICREGITLVTAPVRRTLRYIYFDYIAEVWNRHDELPGQLYKESLEVGPRQKIIAMTATAASRLTGYHQGEGGILALMGEAQGLDTQTWEAFFSNVVSEDDVLVAYGNPIEPAGPYFRACSGEGWKRYQLSALEHPNVVEGEEVIPGGPSRRWVNRMREQWGEESRQWTSRVLGKFPSSAEDSLYLASWIDSSMARHEEGVLDAVAEDGQLVIAVDPAGRGPDRTAIAVRRGPKIEEIRTYDHTTGPQLLRRVRAVLNEYEVETVANYEAQEGTRTLDYSEMPRVVVDATGMGSHLYDTLEEEGYNTVAFMAGESAAERARFANVRAEAAWKVREQLEVGSVAMPPDEELREELLAVRWGEDAKGRVQIPKKTTMRQKLNRSPDKADAAIMALGSDHLEAGYQGIGLWIGGG